MRPSRGRNARNNVGGVLAVGRTGKVFNIVKAMSLRAGVLRRSIELYKAIMFGPSELSRAERELLAVVVSRANDCHY